MNSNVAVFLDRDNTLNYDPGYINNPSDVKLMKGVAKGLKILKEEFNPLLIVISNQSGVARGYFTESDIVAVNNRINELLELENSVKIDDFFFCIHHPDFSSKEDSECRKPSPKMVFEASKKYDIDLSVSYFIGDSISDIQCSNNAGTKSVFLLYDESELQRNEIKELNLRVDFFASDFLSACNFIINDFKKEK